MIVPDRLDAVQTLVYYDGPFSEVLRDRVTGDLYYAHWADVDATHHTWLVASMPAERLRLLGDGHLFVRDLLESAEALYVGRHDGERWCSMTPAVFAHLDPEWVPDADAILPREEWHEKEMAQWSSDPAEIEALAVSVFDDEATPADLPPDTARAHGHQWTLDGYEARCARCDMELVAVVVRVGRKLTSEIRVAGRAGEVFNPRKHRCSP